MDEHGKMGRRDFVLNLGVIGGLVVAAGGSLAHALRFLLPGLARPPERRVRVGRVDAVPEGKALFRNIGGVPFVLINRGGTIRAFSSVCTHLGCRIKWRPQEEIFFCPCHLGKFNADGVNIAGPPPRPLDEYKVEITGGNVFVFLPLSQQGGGMET